MANIKISRKEFEKDIGKLNEEMQHKIAMLGTPLESFNDEEIELEIFPNRPDMLSYQGFKRAFLGFLGKEKRLHSKDRPISKEHKAFYSLRHSKESYAYRLKNKGNYRHPRKTAQYNRKKKEKSSYRSLPPRQNITPHNVSGS